MARRHKNIGGGAWYTGASSNVAKEAKEKKDGGAVAKKNTGGMVKRAYGGRTMGAHSGFKAGGRLDKRARGGSIPKLATGGGADRHPFSSAGANARHATGGAVKKK